MIDDRVIQAALRDLLREPMELSGDGLADALAQAASTPRLPADTATAPSPRPTADGTTGRPAKASPGPEGSARRRLWLATGVFLVAVALRIVARSARARGRFDEDSANE